MVRPLPGLFPKKVQEIGGGAHRSETTIVDKKEDCTNSFGSQGNESRLTWAAQDKALSR